MTNETTKSDKCPHGYFWGAVETHCDGCKLDAAESVCESVEQLLEEAKRGYLDWRLLEIQVSDWRKMRPRS